MNNAKSKCIISVDNLTFIVYRFNIDKGHRPDRNNIMSVFADVQEIAELFVDTDAALNEVDQPIDQYLDSIDQRSTVDLELAGVPVTLYLDQDNALINYSRGN